MNIRRHARPPDVLPAPLGPGVHRCVGRLRTPPCGTVRLKAHRWWLDWQPELSIDLDGDMSTRDHAFNSRTEDLASQLLEAYLFHLK